jgi:hypothetical protein
LQQNPELFQREGNWLEFADHFALFLGLVQLAILLVALLLLLVRLLLLFALRLFIRLLFSCRWSGRLCGSGGTTIEIKVNQAWFASATVLLVLLVFLVALLFLVLPLFLVLLSILLLVFTLVFALLVLPLFAFSWLGLLCNSVRRTMAI